MSKIGKSLSLPSTLHCCLRAPPQLAPSRTTAKTPVAMAKGKTRDGDFLLRLEAYLDNTLKISRYATKIILSPSLLPKTLPLNHRLRSFELVVEDANALWASPLDYGQDLILSLFTYDGEGTYYFFKYNGSVNMKMRDLRRLWEEEMHFFFFFWVKKLRKLREKKLMKKLFVVQGLAELAELEGLLAQARNQSSRGGNGSFARGWGGSKQRWSLRDRVPWSSRWRRKDLCSNR
ncbi:hypothetical protein ACJRO7_032052 [Eucalyptus globulus]|uniref:Uncharacterized protein n=1 Tax=Eucalyptus globulus TaxID=34317 RepID=A0ABD3JN33_EUCGL